MQITTEFVGFVLLIIGVISGAWWRVELAIKASRDEMCRFGPDRVFDNNTRTAAR